VLLPLTDIVPSQSCRTTGTAFFGQMAFFMSVLKRAENRMIDFRENDKNASFLQLRNSVVVFINIVIPSDCQYYF
jgi:hypothetical protein